MTISVFDAANHLCKLSGMSLSNLRLQKLIYLSHMLHLGEVGQPLIREYFEAWDYGPVQPDLYHTLKIYGSSPVKHLLHKTKKLDDESPEANCLNEAYEQLSHRSASWLVAITHWKKGAWAKTYVPGVRGLVIPNESILEEYRERDSEQRGKEESVSV